MSVKRHKTMSRGMFYGCALGIILGVAFKSSLCMIICIGIGSAIDLFKYSRKSKHNK